MMKWMIGDKLKNEWFVFVSFYVMLGELVKELALS